MDNLFTEIGGYVITGLMGIGGFLMKTYHTRLTEVEKEVPNKLNELQVRLLINDKVEPIREDIKDIKAQLDQVIKLLLNR